MIGYSHTVTPSPTLRRLLLDHRIWCNPDCCKGEAFQITAGSIARWLEGERIDRSGELAEEIGCIKAGLPRSEGQIFLAARGMESGWSVGDFRAFWGCLEAAFALAVGARERDDEGEPRAATDPTQHGAFPGNADPLGGPAR
jgi:hypothetical protein